MREECMYLTLPLKHTLIIKRMKVVRSGGSMLMKLVTTAWYAGYRKRCL